MTVKFVSPLITHKMPFLYQFWKYFSMFLGKPYVQYKLDSNFIRIYVLIQSKVTSSFKLKQGEEDGWIKKTWYICTMEYNLVTWLLIEPNPGNL